VTSRLDQPQEFRRRFVPATSFSNETFGRASETFARWMGTAQFLFGMTVFVGLWLALNTVLPESAQFDPRATNYTLLTLILSLRASYAAPLILLAQNRQADRDRVALEQDRARDERNLADTEFSPARWLHCGSRCGTVQLATSSAPSCASCWTRWKTAG